MADANQELVDLNSSDQDTDAADGDEDEDVVELLTTEELCKIIHNKYTTDRPGLGAFRQVLQELAAEHSNLTDHVNELIIHGVLYGDHGFMELLLDAFVVDINLNQTSEDVPGGDTCLTLACKRGTKEIITLLLGKGAKVTSKTMTGDSCLDIASENGHVSCVEVLLQHMKRQNKVSSNDRELTEVLYYGLISAAYAGHTQVLQVYINEGCDVNLNVDDALGTALHRSIDGENMECLDLLLQAGADIEGLRKEVQQTPLMRAAEHGNVDMVGRLLENGAKIDRMTDECAAALTIACHFGQKDCVKYLSDHGADCQLRNPWGYTPLFMGADSPEIARILVDSGVTLDTLCGKRGEAAIHLACVIGSLETVSLLLDRGSNINILTYFGETPLWLTAWKDHVTVCRLLLQRNCTLDVPSNGCKVYTHDYMPVEIAMGLGHSKIMKMMLLAGASVWNQKYFTESENGCLPEIPWVRLRPEPLQFIHMNNESCEWLVNFVTNPRSLKHLSRLYLRRWLSSTLKKNLKSLEIPEDVKAYLYFCDL